MNVSSFYIFKNNKGEEFIYSGLTNLLLAYNDRVKRMLGGQTSDAALAKYLFGEAKAAQAVEASCFDSLVLFVTNQCNMACSYCFERANSLDTVKKMTGETLQQALIYFLENFDHPPVISICFFGGEPLLNLPLLKQSMAFFHELAAEYQVRFTYGIATNGTIINDEILDWIIKNDIQVQVGMDGLETTHNLYRQFTDGKATYQTVVANVKKLAEYCTVSARITLTDLRMDLIKTAVELKACGFSEIKMEYVAAENFKSNRALAEFAANLELFANFFLETIHQKQLLNWAIFIKLLKKIHLGSYHNTFPCRAGVSQFAVATDGSIYLCHRFNNCPEYQCGDVYQGIDQEKRRAFLAEHQKFERLNNHCQNCWAQAVCGGTCYHASYINQGDTRLNSDFHCEYWKLILAKVLYIYASLTEEEKVFINHLKR